MKFREKWIDMSRSIVMILVIFGHIGTYLISKGYHNSIMPAFFMLTSAIKIPGFFAISGYLFNDKQGNWVEFLKNKVQKILVPYLCLGMISMILNILNRWIQLGAWDQNITKYALNYFKNYLLGKNLWFIPCLFVVEIMFFIIKKICRDNLLSISFLSLVICVIGYFWSETRVTIPWRLDTALICVFFLFIGYFLRYLSDTKKIILTSKMFLFSFLVYIILAFVSFNLYQWKNLDVNQNYYYNFLLCIIMIIVGIIVLFSGCKILPSCWLLNFIGQNTLTYFTFHLFFAKIVFKVFERFTNVLEYIGFLPLAISICIITLIFMIPFVKLINKYFPFIVGKSYRSSL